MNTDMEFSDRSVTERWMAIAACRGQPAHFWFPPAETANRFNTPGRMICRTCPVKVACLDYALEKRVVHGIWGGATEAERRRILKSSRSKRFDLTMGVLNG